LEPPEPPRKRRCLILWFTRNFLDSYLLIITYKYSYLLFDAQHDHCNIPYKNKYIKWSRLQRQVIWTN
jgi:hypothetical protein